MPQWQPLAVTERRGYTLDMNKNNPHGFTSLKSLSALILLGVLSACGPRDIGTGTSADVVTGKFCGLKHHLSGGIADLRV